MVRFTKRAKLLCGLGALLVLMCLAVLWLLTFSEAPGNQPAFRLDFVRQVRNGATNIIVFRLTSLASKHAYSLLTPGTISTPLPSNGFAPSVVFLEARPSPVYGPWTFLGLPA